MQEYTAVRTYNLLIFWTITYLTIFGGSQFVGGVKVCNNFEDYSKSELTPNCFEDESVNWNISERIRSWGFTAEEHYVYTSDGYNLLIERAYANISQSTPIFLGHCMTVDAISYVFRRENSLAMYLGSHGYDVWMINYRGTKYSRRHANLTTNDDKYWQFSIHELGIYDVRAALKYVMERTKKKLIYLGMSLSTTTFFVYASLYPEEAQSAVKGAIHLAPVTTLKESNSTLRYLSPVWASIRSTSYRDFHGEIPLGIGPIFKSATSNVVIMHVFHTFLMSILGGSYEQMDPISYPHVLLDVLDNTGVDVAGNYIQIYQTNIFQAYDYGPKKNREIYASKEALVYNMSNISVPMALFVGNNDLLGTMQSCKQIYDEIQPKVRCGFHIVDYTPWSHFDFLSAKDVIFYAYRHIKDKIKQIDFGKCFP